MKKVNTISAVELGKILMKNHVWKCTAEGLSEKESIETFTIDVANAQAEEFCKKYNYRMV